MFFGLREARRLRRRARGCRNRKKERALREEQHNETAEIAD
jgi:hypothetical protein